MATAGVTRSLVPNASLPAKVQPLAPNQTLYITNLPSSKIQKADLRTALYMLFSTFGPVLDVVALKTMSMRGQAHIVFRDIQSATQAMRSLDGQSFLGKPLKIQYAKGKSHFVSKLDGSFKPPNASGAAGIEQTELQQSIFNAPPPAALTSSNTAAPAKPAASADQEMKDVNTSGNRGHKRTRDDDDDSDSDVAMEEDSDDE